MGQNRVFSPRARDWMRGMTLTSKSTLSLCEILFPNPEEYTYITDYLLCYYSFFKCSRLMKVKGSQGSMGLSFFLLPKNISDKLKAFVQSTDSVDIHACHPFTCLPLFLLFHFHSLIYSLYSFVRVLY